MHVRRGDCIHLREQSNTQKGPDIHVFKNKKNKKNTACCRHHICRKEYKMVSTHVDKWAT